MLSWLDATEAQKFGTSLAHFFMEKMPLGFDLKEKKFASKAQQVLVKLAQQAEQFKRGHKLNTYKKAKLGNSFKWTLKDAGYDSVYVDELTEWLMLRL